MSMIWKEGKWRRENEFDDATYFFLLLGFYYQVVFLLNLFKFSQAQAHKHKWTKRSVQRFIFLVYIFSGKTKLQQKKNAGLATGLLPHTDRKSKTQIPTLKHKKRSTLCYYCLLYKMLFLVAVIMKFKHSFFRVITYSIEEKNYFTFWLWAFRNKMKGRRREMKRQNGRVFYIIKNSTVHRYN